MSDTPTIHSLLTEARRLEGERTQGGWTVLENQVPYRAAGFEGTTTERRIITSYDHPQLKGPAGVVNIATVAGTGANLVSIDAEDAAFIAFWGTHAPAILAYVGELEQERDQYRRESAPQTSEGQ